MKNQLLKSLLVVTLLACYFSAKAEDIDLFVGAPPASAADLPNLMIVLDNAANFSSSASNCTYPDGSAPTLNGTAGGIEQCALYQAISGITVPVVNGVEKPTVNIGMMVYNANNIRDINNANCGGANGGCLVQPLIPLNTANKTAFLTWIKSWKTTGGAGSGYIKASGEATGAAMQETWAYFAGRTGLSGRSYLSIKPAAVCNNNYIIFVGNSYTSAGTPGDSTGDKGPKGALEGSNSTADMNVSPAATPSQKAAILSTLNTTCGAYTFPSSSHENKGFYADEWARYMSGQKITTYTIGVLGSNCQAQYAALLTSMAEYGNGNYYPTTDYTTLVSAFRQILSEVQSVNSVFSSVSLPVSVNTQGTFLNQVYIGMFRPDKHGLPRWYGNLKQYKLGYVGNSTTLQLLDADNTRAISSSGSGFVAECARSFWTPVTPDNYWTFLSIANCTGYSAQSNTPDGNLVEKGAQAYQLRSTPTRTVKTCSPTTASTTCTALTDFNNSNVTPSMLGTTVTATERDALVNWQHGLDVDDENEDSLTLTQTRPSVHGDVVHSRPVAINYGTDAAPQVVVFYGGNDGILRAVNGNRTASIGSAAAGSELWAFVAPEFYSKIKRIRDNTVPISFPGYTTGTTTTTTTPTGTTTTTTTPTPLPKDYGVDGPIVAYQDASSTTIFAAMRRGGRVLYALNVTIPASPAFKWKIGCPNAGDDTGCTSGFTGLGQTWSAPKVLKAGGYGSGVSPMLIMGGGYDTCQDADPNTGCSSFSKGTKIYVLDANTGALLKTFNTDSSVIADLTIVPDSTGLIKYAYAADLGGNVYRISGADANSPIGTTAPASWTITKIATLGGSGTDNRKFMFPPDILDDNGTYVLLLGSGDREKPLSSYISATAVENRFFVIKDKPTDATWLTLENTTCGANIICTNSLFAITSTTPTQTELATKSKGWYLPLASTEQVVTSAITVFGTVTFSTHEPTAPAAGQCSSLGTAQVYNLNYTNAASTSGTVRGQVIAGGGLPPSPVAGMVTLDNGTTVPFIIGANPGSALQGGNPPPPSSVVRPRSRVYWNIKK
ncbi:MAG: PilC/PilY family type IV pilus protein [Pseudomonadota bacterium]